MTWIGLLAALVVTLLLQTTVGRVANPPLPIDLLLALTLVYGLIAPAADARLAAWIIGFACDLTTEGPLGIHALAFGLTGWLLTRLRERLNPEFWWARLLVGFSAALPGQLLVPLHLRFVQGGGGISLWGSLSSAVLLSAIAALLAVLITLLPPLTPRRRAGHRPPWVRSGA